MSSFSLLTKTSGEPCAEPPSPARAALSAWFQSQQQRKKKGEEEEAEPASSPSKQSVLPFLYAPSCVEDFTEPWLFYTMQQYYETNGFTEGIKVRKDDNNMPVQK